MGAAALCSLCAVCDVRGKAEYVSAMKFEGIVSNCGSVGNVVIWVLVD